MAATDGLTILTQFQVEVHMRTIHFTAAVAMLVASVSNSWAGAVLQSGASVQSLHGAKAAVIAAGADIAPGTRIINRDAKGEASLAFDDGCSITLAPGQVFTVGQASPCSFRAQEAGMGLSAPLLIGGLVITGAVIGGIVLATQKHDSRPWVPLSF